MNKDEVVKYIFSLLEEVDRIEKKLDNIKNKIYNNDNTNMIGGDENDGKNS